MHIVVPLGEQTRWCVPHAVYHAYLPQECVNELYSGSQYDHINLPPHSTEWSLVDRTQGLVFFLTHLIPTQKHVYERSSFIDKLH